MPCIHAAPAEVYVPLFGEDASPAQQIHAHIPELALLYGAFTSGVRDGARSLPARLTELVRLRIAFHNQCRSCMALRYESAQDDGVTEGLVCSLERPHEAPDLTDAERAALDYADRMAGDHLSITDETYENLRTHFTEAEIVELGFNCALCVGFGRLAATWDMVEQLPERFQERGAPVTPWEPDAAA